jgi:hypothetical protein
VREFKRCGSRRFDAFAIESNGAARGALRDHDRRSLRRIRSAIRRSAGIFTKNREVNRSISLKCAVTSRERIAAPRGLST